MSAGAIGGMGGMGGAAGAAGAVGSTPAAAGNAKSSGVSEVGQSPKVSISTAAEKALSAESTKAATSSTNAASSHLKTHGAAESGSINSKVSDLSIVTNLNVNIDIQNIDASVDGLNGKSLDDIIAALLIAMIMQQQEKRASFL